MCSTAPRSREGCSKSKANRMANTKNANIDLKALRLRNVNKLIIAHLNKNSLRNKFYFLISLIKGNIDVLMISETKLDESFPTNRFINKVSVFLSVFTEMIKTVVLFYILERICHQG